MLRWGWLDLLSSVPAVDFLRIGRAARILRILRILRGIRTDDFACRMGGEEFLLVISDPEATDALTIAQRVRETIRSTPVEAEGHSIRVTISMGLAYFDPASTVSPEEVIRLADAGLYRAKETGRDRIISHIETSA